jgi:hypothetical protein
MSQFGGKDSKRHFTVVMGNKEHGLYVSSTPSSAAKKAVTKLCAANKGKKVEFHIREITQGSKKKTYGPYEGYIEKLKKPIKLKSHVIEHKPVAKLSMKKSEMKGGVLTENQKIAKTLRFLIGDVFKEEQQSFNFPRYLPTIQEKINKCLDFLEGKEGIDISRDDISSILSGAKFSFKNKTNENLATLDKDEIVKSLIAEAIYSELTRVGYLYNPTNPRNAYNILRTFIYPRHRYNIPDDILPLAMYYLYFRNFSEYLMSSNEYFKENPEKAKKFLEKLNELESKFAEYPNSNMDKFPDLLAKEKIYLSQIIHSKK